jgi:hypothetical protein
MHKNCKALGWIDIRTSAAVRQRSVRIPERILKIVFKGPSLYCRRLKNCFQNMGFLGIERLRIFRRFQKHKTLV